MTDVTFKKQTQLKKEKMIQDELQVLPGFVSQYLDFIHLSTSASTRLEYVRDIGAFLNYVADNLDMNVMELTPADLDTLSAEFLNGYLNYLSMYEKDGKTITNENVSIRRKLSSLRGIYNYLFEGEIIEHNPILRVKPPKVAKKDVIRMDETETKDFLDTVENGLKMTKKELAYHDKYGFRDFTLLSLMLGTGIRVSEAVGLNITDVDLKNHGIRVIRKGNKEETVFFSDVITEILSDYIELYRKKIIPAEGHEKALFLSSQRSRITTRAVQYMVKKYTTHTELLKHITPHKLRSTFGTKLYEETSDLYLVADVLGHSSVETSKVYVDQTKKRKIANRNKVNWNAN